MSRCPARPSRLFSRKRVAALDVPAARYKEYYYSAMYPKGGFIYPAGSLSFSVAVYCGCAVVWSKLISYPLRGDWGDVWKSMFRVCQMVTV